MDVHRLALGQRAVTILHAPRVRLAVQARQPRCASPTKVTRQVLLVVRLGGQAGRALGTSTLPSGSPQYSLVARNDRPVDNQPAALKPWRKRPPTRTPMCCSAFPPHAQQLPANLAQRSAAIRRACTALRALADLRILLRGVREEARRNRLPNFVPILPARHHVQPVPKTKAVLVLAYCTSTIGTRGEAAEIDRHDVGQATQRQPQPRPQPHSGGEQTAQPRSQRRQSFRFRFPQKESLGAARRRSAVAHRKPSERHPTVQADAVELLCIQR